MFICLSRFALQDSLSSRCSKLSKIEMLLDILTFDSSGCCWPECVPSIMTSIISKGWIELRWSYPWSNMIKQGMSCLLTRVAAGEGVNEFNASRSKKLLLSPEKVQVDHKIHKWTMDWSEHLAAFFAIFGYISLFCAISLPQWAVQKHSVTGRHSRLGGRFTLTAWLRKVVVAFRHLGAQQGSFPHLDRTGERRSSEGGTDWQQKGPA